ncbi:phage portal protein [Aeromonas veronii]|uniref:phage portal protein n=1 Tax=Aeromonas veronii TaxID=654 RepID=UPI003D24A94B
MTQEKLKRRDGCVKSTPYQRNRADLEALMNINQKTELNAVVSACIKIIAETVGKLPCYLYQVTSDGEHKILEHKNLDVLTRYPNDMQTTQDLLEMIIWHLCIDGNFYAVINKTKQSVIADIQPVPFPSSVSIQVVNRRLEYHINLSPQLQSAKRVFTPDEVIHIKMGGPNLLKGLGCVALARQSIEISEAQQRYAQTFTDNASTPSAIVSAKESLTEDQYDFLVETVNTMVSGDNAGCVGVVPAGVDWQSVSLNHKDAQFLESRQFQRNEICSIFKVPPFMIGGTEGMKFSNYEQSMLGFYRDTIAPFLKRIEEAFSRKLQDVRFGIDEKELLRGDTAAALSYAKDLFSSGLISINEARNHLGLSNIKGGENHSLAVNNNMLGELEDIQELQHQLLRSQINKPEQVVEPVVAPVEEPEAQDDLDVEQEELPAEEVPNDAA